jgi:putative DNA primase/helicase
MQNKEPMKPAVHKGKIFHNDMATAIMKVISFLTIRDTEQVLWYSGSAGIYRFDGESKIKEFTQDWLEELGLAGDATTYFMNQVVDYIRRSTYIEREDLNADPNILVVKNGVIDLSTGTLHPHDKKYKATIRIPVEYNARAQCPLINRFISEVVEERDRPLMYEIPAWCLTRQSKIQRLVLLLGEGANGKSTYLEMVRKFLGHENCSAYSMQYLADNRFATSGLFGKLANIHADLPSSALRQTAQLKMLTGGDAIEAEKKFKDSFSFVNTAKLIFSANQPPEFNEDTLAIWRRFIIVDFPFRFIGESADKNMLEKVTAPTELSGFLNQVLYGLKRLHKNNDFSYARTIEETRSKYMLISDPVEAFIDMCCEFGPWGIIAKEDLYQAFQRFCEEHKLAGMNKKAFGHKLKQAHRYDLSEERGEWRGISLKKA